jgi:RNA polymerase sigma factor (sigma-70 family)
VSEQINSSESTLPEKTLDPGLYHWASRELHRFIESRLVRSGNGGEEARELLSVVLERFWKSRHHLIRKPVPYLIRIAENVLNEFLLRQSRSVVTYDSSLASEAASDLSDTSGWDDQLIDRIATEQQLRRVLAQIPPMYCAVLILRTRDCMDNKQVAKELGITPGTARIYFQRALAACRSADWDR